LRAADRERVDQDPWTAARVLAEIEAVRSAVEPLAPTAD
jgi:hypothetical protein